MEGKNQFNDVWVLPDISTETYEHKISLNSIQFKVSIPLQFPNLTLLISTESKIENEIPINFNIQLESEKYHDHANINRKFKDKMRKFNHSFRIKRDDFLSLSGEKKILFCIKSDLSSAQAIQRQQNKERENQSILTPNKETQLKNLKTPEHLNSPIQAKKIENAEIKPVTLFSDKIGKTLENSSQKVTSDKNMMQNSKETFVHKKNMENLGKPQLQQKTVNIKEIQQEISKKQNLVKHDMLQKQQEIQKQEPQQKQQETQQKQQKTQQKQQETQQKQQETQQKQQETQQKQQETQQKQQETQQKQQETQQKQKGAALLKNDTLISTPDKSLPSTVSRPASQKEKTGGFLILNQQSSSNQEPIFSNTQNPFYSPSKSHSQSPNTTTLSMLKTKKLPESYKYPDNDNKDNLKSLPQMERLKLLREQEEKNETEKSAAEKYQNKINNFKFPSLNERTKKLKQMLQEQKSKSQENKSQDIKTIENKSIENKTLENQTRINTWQHDSGETFSEKVKNANTSENKRANEFSSKTNTIFPSKFQSSSLNSHRNNQNMVVSLSTQPIHTNSLPKESTTQYSGLRNQGATCYMNSMLQALYHLPAFRRLIYSMSTDSPDGKEESNIPLQMQRLFANMQSKLNNACSTRALTTSFGWGDAETIMQHDVQEFCRVILDNLETKIDKQPNLKGSIQNLFRGKTRSFIRCRNVKYESSREEDFYDLSLLVKNCRNLQESFEKYIEPESLVGKNQYNAEGFGLQDADMGNEFILFPPVLHLHLRRFEFDGYGMSKINSRFEFQPEINLGRYMPKNAKDRDKQIYELFGVLVHSGSAMGGHYYAYLRPTKKNEWYEFNDSSVSRVSSHEAIKNNFGGASSYFSGISCSQGAYGMNQKCYSAYMLVYIRKSNISEIYRDVSDDEIPKSIKDFVVKQAELMRKREEERRILENTIEIKIFSDKHIDDMLTSNNKLIFPNVNSPGIHKIKVMKGDRNEIIYQKVAQEYQQIINGCNPENNNDDNTNYRNILIESGNFELYSMGYSGIAENPIEKNKIVDQFGVKMAYLYTGATPEIPEEELYSINSNSILSRKSPFLLIFVCAYFSQLKKPIRFLKTIKVYSKSIVKKVFDEEITIVSKLRLFKRLAPQELEQIKKLDSTFEENRINNGSMIVIDTDSEPPSLFIEQENNIANENQNHLKESDNEIIKYSQIYPPLSIRDYFNINKNLASLTIVYQNKKYRVSFPTNQPMKCFISFLHIALSIDSRKTIVLYRDLLVPLLFKPEATFKDKFFGILPNLNISVYAFEYLSENIFQHSLRINYYITYNLEKSEVHTSWFHENSDFNDLKKYAFLHHHDIIKENDAVVFYKATSDSSTFYSLDDKLKNIDSTIYIQIKDRRIRKYTENYIILFLRKEILKEISNTQSSTNSSKYILFDVIDDEKLADSVQRMIDIFDFNVEKLKECKLIITGNSSLLNKRVLVADDVLSELMKKGFNKLQIHKAMFSQQLTFRKTFNRDESLSINN